jgi:hypothetical protein
VRDFYANPSRGGFKVKAARLVGNAVPNPPPEPFIWPSEHAGMFVMVGTGP